MTPVKKWTIVIFTLCCCSFLPTISSATTSTQTLQEEEEFTNEKSLSLISPYILDLGEITTNPQLLSERFKMMQNHLHHRRHRALVEGEHYNKNDVKHGPMAKIGGALTALYNVEMEEKATQQQQDDASDQGRRTQSLSEPLTEAAASSLGISIHDGRVTIDIVVDTLDADNNELDLNQVMNSVLSNLDSLNFMKTGQYGRMLSGSILIDQLANLASLEYITSVRPVRGQTLTLERRTRNRNNSNGSRKKGHRNRNRARTHKQRKWSNSSKKDTTSSKGRSGKKISWWNGNGSQKQPFWNGKHQTSWWWSGSNKSAKGGKSSKGGKKGSYYQQRPSSWHYPEKKCGGGTRDPHDEEYCEPHTGLVISQGDGAMMTNKARRKENVRGRGVTVGVISSSFGCSNADLLRDVRNGELPSDGVTILDDGCEGSFDNDEGRAMSQIIHDVAPGAELAFHPGFQGQASFAQGILELARDAGASVIVDDVFLFNDPMFMDGVIAQAVNAVSEGFDVSYIVSSGNLGTNSFETFVGAGGFIDAGGTLKYDFNGNGDVRQTIEVGPGTSTIVLQWDEPYASAGAAGGSTNDLDLIVYLDGDPIFLSDDANIGNDPIEVLAITNSGPPIIIEIEIILFEGDPPGFMKYVIFGQDPNIKEYDTKSSTSFGHFNTESVISIGAAYWRDTPPFGVSPAIHRDFSSLCGCPIFFDPSGNRLNEPLIYELPTVVGPDGGSTSVVGFDVFDGTSASAPHIAGVVALMLEAKCYDLSPDQVRSILQMTASDMDDKTTPDFDVGFDFTTGYGYVDAPGAIAMAKGN